MQRSPQAPSLLPSRVLKRRTRVDGLTAVLHARRSRSVALLNVHLIAEFSFYSLTIYLALLETDVQLKVMF